MTEQNLNTPELLDEIRKCKICEHHLPFGPRPIVNADQESRLIIIGQAPGMKVHNSGVPWDDQSGKLLRMWLGIDHEQFYDPKLVAIIPMGFCYPGKGKSGDLPPRKECAETWHELILNNLSNVKLTLLIGQYSQRYYLGKSVKKNLTETVKSFQEYLPYVLPLPHPSPRNRIWIKKNPWFNDHVVPSLQSRVKEILQ